MPIAPSLIQKAHASSKALLQNSREVNDILQTPAKRQKLEVKEEDGEFASEDWQEVKEEDFQNDSDTWQNDNMII